MARGPDDCGRRLLMTTDDAYKALKALEGVKDVNIEIVSEPDWTPEKTKPKVRVLMGF